MYRAELVAEHAGLRLDRDISPYSFQPSPRFCLRDGTVFVLDETLTATTRRSVGLSSDARLLNAAMDLSIVVAADQSALVIVAAVEARLPLSGAQVACVFPGGHVLVTAPVPGTGHRVLLMEAGGQVLDEVLLDVPDSYLSATQHPVAPLAVLTAGAGQDGSRLFSVAEVDRRLVVGALAENVIATSFNPSGTRLLITGHPSFRPMLGVLSWPDGKQLRSVTGPELGLPPDDSLGVCGCYLDDDRALALTLGGKLMALDDRLGALAEVSLASVSERPGFLIGVSPVSFAVQTWQDGAAGAWVWRLPPSPA